MIAKFSLYDLLGCLFPGGTVVLVLYWLGKYVQLLPLPALPNDLGGSILFLGLIYIVGQFVQAIGSMCEDLYNKIAGGRLSERLLSKGKSTFSSDFRKNIEDCARGTFGTSVSSAHPSQKELFELCYALIVQQGLAQRTEIFLAINGLARGMVVSLGLGFFVSLLVFLAQISLLPHQVVDILHLQPVPKSLEPLKIQIGVLITFLIAILLAIISFVKYRKYFATSVYYNFMAWYARQKQGAAGTASNSSGTATAVKPEEEPSGDGNVQGSNSSGTATAVKPPTAQ